MPTSIDHPELAFVQAKSYTKGRTGAPLWIVVHDMEAGESSTRAESTATYFATLTDGRSVSSHYCVDSDSVVQCVLLKDTAHTTGGNPGNPRGINWELAGFARQTRAEWLDPFGLAMFARMAPIVRADAARFGIPLQRRTVAELKAFKPGITSHNDIREAFGGTTHTDPGPNFPWDVFLSMMRGDDDMALRDDGDGRALIYRVAALIQNLDEARFKLPDGTERVEPNKLKAALAAVQAPQVDAGAVAAALASNADFLAAMAKAVNDDAAARLRD